MSSTFIRFFFSDWQVLAYIKMHGYGYSRQIAESLHKTRRAIHYTLTKLEKLNLVQREGCPRCPFQFFQLNLLEKEKVKGLIRFFGTLFSLKTFNKNTSFLFNEKDFDVRSRKVFRDPGRRFGHSIPWISQKIMKNFYQFLKDFYGYTSPNLPTVLPLRRNYKKMILFIVAPISSFDRWRSFILNRNDVYHYDEWIAEKRLKISKKNYGISYIKNSIAIAATI